LSALAAEPKESTSGKARRLKPYPAYKHSGVEWLGKLPAHWGMTKMWAVAEAHSGATPAKETLRYWDGGIPWVSPKDMKRRFIDSSEDTVSAAAISEAGLKIVPDPAVLVVVRGMILAHAFPVALTTVPVTINQDMKALRLREQLEPQFFAWWLEGIGPELRAVLVEEAAHGTKAIRMDRWRTTPVEVPPHSEQRAIVAFLDRETARINELLAKKERLIELLQEKRAALITCAFTNGLDSDVPTRETGGSLLPDIPNGWRPMKLRRLLARVSRPVRVEPEAEYREIGIRSWGKGIFHKDAVRGAQLEDKSVFYVKPGDLILNIVFAWEGAVAIVSEREDGMVASHRFPTFRLADDQADLDYLLMYLQSEQGRALMGLNSPGAAGRNRTIRLDSFLNEEIPVPPLQVQREIVKSFRATEQLFGAAEIKARALIDCLRELRAAVISAAVTGKIDVREQVVA